MSAVTILGAGAMGSAMVTPAVAAGHDVRLWGTWLDEERIRALETNNPHPGTGVKVPRGARLFRFSDLAAALADTDVVIISVASVGVTAISELLTAHLQPEMAVLMTSKGFHLREDGTIGLMPEAIEAGLKKSLDSVVCIGGPCKANEVAAALPTATIYASADEQAAKNAARLLQTDEYRIAITSDVVGLEVSAPLKNVFAIALGYADGLQEASTVPRHNLKSALFAQAIKEMATITEALNGDTRTAYGLAGVGDLEVTGLSGRNKVFGTLLGHGSNASEAIAEMERRELTVEGVSACPLAVKLADQLNLTAGELPLLFAIDAVLEAGVDPASAFLSGLPTSVPAD